MRKGSLLIFIFFAGMGAGCLFISIISGGKQTDLEQRASSYFREAQQVRGEVDKLHLELERLRKDGAGVKESSQRIDNTGKRIADTSNKLIDGFRNNIENIGSAQSEVDEIRRILYDVQARRGTENKEVGN